MRRVLLHFIDLPFNFEYLIKELLWKLKLTAIEGVVLRLIVAVFSFQILIDPAVILCFIEHVLAAVIPRKKLLDIVDIEIIIKYGLIASI